MQVGKVMPYDCNTCGKLHRTNEICDKPMKEFVEITPEKITKLAKYIKYWWGNPHLNLEEAISKHLK